MHRSLRVAIDASSLQHRPLGGVGRGLNEVLPLLARNVELTLLTDARLPAPHTELPVTALDAWPPRGPKTLWLHQSVRRWLRGFDGVFHGPYYAVPFGVKVPAVVTLHDLSFEVHPEGQHPARRRLYQMQARYAARRSRVVVTVSEFTKAQLVQRYGLSPDRVLVAWNAVDAVFDAGRAEAAAELATRMSVRQPYLIALGGARRRGIEVAIGAWRRVRAGGLDVDLVVVGESSIAGEQGLTLAGNPDDATWATLLAGAEAFVYPTRYEGFGMPALEAAASGTPVVCAKVASLPEVLGDAAQWCDEPTVEALVPVLAGLLSDEHRLRALTVAGLARTRGWPGWDAHAAVLLEAYRRAAA